MQSYVDGKLVNSCNFGFWPTHARDLDTNTTHFKKCDPYILMALPGAVHQ